MEVVQTPTQGQALNQAPPRPPGRMARSVMDLGTDRSMGGGIQMADPIVQIMQSMGSTRNALTQLAARLPQIAPGIQQFLAGLEQVVPQFVADLQAGQQPGMGAPGGGAMVNQAPTAPPVTTSAV